jgi:hypothetical protein
VKPGNTKGGSITVPSTSCLTVSDKTVLQIKTKIVSCHTADSKPVKQEVDGTVYSLVKLSRVEGAQNLTKIQTFQIDQTSICFCYCLLLTLSIKYK